MRYPIFLIDEDSDEEDIQHYVQNIVVVGKTKTGKSSIIRRLIRNYFSLFYTPTTNIEFSQPVLVGNNFYRFYEVPYSYDFQHNWYIKANIIFVLEDIEVKWWEKFLSTIDATNVIEVFFITQKKTIKQKYRQYHVDALEFSGFSDLMFDIANL